MSNAAKPFRDAAAFLLAEADKIDGKTSATGFTTYGGRTVTVQEAYALMIDEWTRGEKPHEWREWGNGNPLPENAGNNEREPAIYEGAKQFWSQMERQTPFVYDDHGQRFHNLTCVRRGGWPDFERNVRRMWAGPEGAAWRAAPENASVAGRIKV